MKDKIEFIAFVGAGNVAWHLAPVLDNAGLIVSEVYSRDRKKSRQLVNRLYQAEVKDSLDFSDSGAEVILLTVADDAIEEVAANIVMPPDAILVHTSGSTPLSALDKAGTPNTGVIYPLQTFSKGAKVNLEETPVFVEGSNPLVTRHLLTIGRAISSTVLAISTEKRMALHLAGVFASNFTNHMIAIAFELMERQGLEPQWLEPLIAETINKGLDAGPENAQTGPARRGDLKILQKHAEFLKKDKALREIYTIISQHILDKYRS
ncbi:MAG TPA: DUF2520 domain-containing protein [Cyclobacteriaceae bacterium]|nr:DUF2520 domain-containing protein [Cyclobacteriaceae bacterium]